MIRVRLQLTATAPTAACPCCAVSASSVHSRYQRHLTDRPWRTHAVHRQLTVRKFCCRNLSCVRRMFTEPSSARGLTPYIPYLIHRWRES
jgi:transposase